MKEQSASVRLQLSPGSREQPYWERPQPQSGPDGLSWSNRRRWSSLGKEEQPRVSWAQERLCDRGSDCAAAAQVKVNVKGSPRGREVLVATIYAVKLPVPVNCSALMEPQGHSEVQIKQLRLLKGRPCFGCKSRISWIDSSQQQLLLLHAAIGLRPRNGRTRGRQIKCASAQRRQITKRRV